ncbi:Scr1 family TA system antitoxin-like transcriptional regulator [Streptomyces massasporeus]|uniref:Scr1 family TA system antitoxin-like transcriptional regulator n=1 Tax=Streptomyces massasporeus TaxID=67324 RepID=UPI00371CE4EF
MPPVRPLWRPRHGFSSSVWGRGSSRAIEARITLLWPFQPALVPGLLQTLEHMRAILSRHEDLSEATVRETVSARLELYG